ncbi:SDR family NAD(P)-dependent oxidoreductase, partial [Paraburkholderia sp.]|uniref:SDR family NAD(P)-dependent oxidoreductase n=1 Tax=Paraburkholderia sp. TaxID=1926495 RepID=UPI002F406B7D
MVTGASGGIGAQIARRLAGSGAVVAAHCGRNRNAADQLVGEIKANGGKAFVVQADLRDVTGLSCLYDAVMHGFELTTQRRQLDFLVNNAGAGGSLPLTQVTPEHFDEECDILFRGTFFMCQLACEHLCDGGRIVNISSNAANGALPYQAVYAAAKAAVNHLTLSFAQHLGHRGITVNAVSPGATDTALIANLRARKGFDESVLRLTALGRLGQTDDIASAVMLLLSPEARWIT